MLKVAETVTQYDQGWKPIEIPIDEQTRRIVTALCPLGAELRETWRDPEKRGLVKFDQCPPTTSVTFL